MSIHTFLAKSSLSYVATLCSRGSSIASDGSQTQEITTLVSNIVGNLSYNGGQQYPLANSLMQESTHFFDTDVVFTIAILNGYLLQITNGSDDGTANVNTYTILDWQPLGVGRNAMSTFFLKQDKV